MSCRSHLPRTLALAGLILAACQGPEPQQAAPRPEARPAAAHSLPLASGKNLESTLAGGTTHAYVFDLPAGQFVDVVVDQQGIDVVVELRAPDGRLLTRVDSPNGAEGPEPVPAVAEVAGRYRLEVAAGAGQAPGRYAIRIGTHRPATDEDRTRVAAERLFAEGKALRDRGEARPLRESLARDRQALALFRSIGDQAREADVLYILGWAHRDLGERAAALDALQQAEQLFQRLGEEEKAGLTLNNLGEILGSLGRPDEQLASYQQALAIHRRVGNTWGEASSLNSLGRFYKLRGETEQALAYYEQALERWRTLGERDSEAVTLTNLGQLYDALGEYGKALGYLQQALPVLQAAGMRRDAAIALGLIGTVQGSTGRERQGIAALRQALRMQREAGDRREEAVLLHHLGWLHIRIGEPRQARSFFTAALSSFRALQDPAGEAAALSNLARLEESGDPAAAEATYLQALALFTATRDYGSEAAALLGLARARRRAGKLPQALEAVEASLAHVESLRRKPASYGLRASYLASKIQHYELCIALLMQLHRERPAAGYDALALAASEEARARSLLDMLSEAAVSPPRPLTLVQIQRQILDSDTMLLEYALGQERSFLWAVTPERSWSFELPRRAILEEAARRAYALLAASQHRLARAQTDMALADLSRLLVGPVADLLGHKRLLVVGDGVLLSIPFAALPIPGANTLLVAEHEILSIPSASLLAVQRRKLSGRKPAARTVAVISDPVFEATDPRVAVQGRTVAGARSTKEARFQRLPFSREEAESILNLVPPDRSFRALDFAASRQTVLSGELSRYRIVHLATHGVLDADRPELSGIVLSQVDPQGRPQDGLLRAHELYRLHLPAELVVVSACRSALGREIPGEGLVGLTRGFLYAGARRVLVSLWEVEDRATAELMRLFYREMLVAGRPPAAALRAAQTALRRQPGHEAPYYWAGFVLQGDWR